MNQIEEIKAIPDWTWAPKTHEEMLRTDARSIEFDVMYQIGGCAVAGLVYNSLINPPYMWFALARGCSIRDLIDFRRIAEFIPRGTTTAVEEGFALGFRFARVYGFEETGKEIEANGLKYKIMRRA